VAFADLQTIRTDWLNDELGITDSGTEYGSTTQRDNMLRRAFAKLWPVMGRLTRQTVTTVADTVDYTLTSIEDVVRIELLGTSGLYGGPLPKWNVYVDEASDVPVIRLRLGQVLSTGSYPSFRVVGFARYKIPADAEDLCDLPDRLLHVVSAGGRVEAYRWKLGQFANFQDFGNENRANSIGPAELSALLASATADFERYKAENQRDISGARR
jgi:hypothetical protein